jgi:hypothetical protein
VVSVTTSVSPTTVPPVSSTVSPTTT